MAGSVGAALGVAFAAGWRQGQPPGL